MSSSDTFSIIVWFWHDQLTNATQLKVVRVDTSEEVQLSDGSFLLGSVAKNAGNMVSSASIQENRGVPYMNNQNPFKWRHYGKTNPLSTVHCSELTR